MSLDNAAEVLVPHKGPDLLAVEAPDVLAGALLAAGVVTAGVWWRQHRLDRRAAEAAANEVMERTLTQEAGGLVLRGMMADVTIRSGADELTVHATGKRKHLDRWQTDTDGTDLVIDDVAWQPLPTKAFERLLFGMPLTPFWRRKIEKLYGWTLTDDSDLCKVEISVPDGTALTLATILGDVEALGTFGDVNVETASKQKTFIETTRNLTVTTGAESQVDIGALNGGVSITQAYRSAVRVRSGRASSLDAKLGTHSRLNFDAEVDSPQARTGYGARASLRLVQGRATFRATGTSSKIIAQGVAPRGELDRGNIETGYGAEVLVHGGINTGLVDAGRKSVVEVWKLGPGVQVHAPPNARILQKRVDRYI